MQNFTDDTGRQWTVRVTVETVRRIREQAGVNVIDVFSDVDLLQKLMFTDHVLVADCLYAAIRPDADKINITKLQFAESLSGDSLESASAAFLDALANFFPKAQRDALTRVLKKSRAAVTEAAQNLEPESV